ncbi:MAG: NPCBM/NEW2 domain-containing protein [Planctomycetes bacterium]|nr:NPCBM/NEW2 domain-containing protein [Planctomycetota bacterium]
MGPMVWAAPVLAVLAGALPAQGPAVELLLRNGTAVVVHDLRGAPDQGLEGQANGQRIRFAAGDVVVLAGVAARAVDLPSAWLSNDEVVRGALAGGDSGGDRLQVVSPVLGRIDLPVERLAAFARAGEAFPLALRLPDGVGEALFQRAAVGFDLVAGTLHQFGEQGVKFQPDGAAAPRWFGLSEFVALRIADPAPRSTPAPVDLVTRAADRLGVVVRRFEADVVKCERDGIEFDVRLTDVACLSFAGTAKFASDLRPSAVTERGYDGDPVHPWRRDAACVGTPMVAAGRTHGKGFGVQAESRLSFVVPEGASHFRTLVALDDSSAELGVAADVDVRLLVGDGVKFEQKGLGAGVVRDTGLVAVRAGDVVTLEAGFGKGRDVGDRVDWLSPMFLFAGGRRP